MKQFQIEAPGRAVWKDAPLPSPGTGSFAGARRRSNPAASPWRAASRRRLQQQDCAAVVGHQFRGMLATLVMTVIGADRPGLVQMVATRVANHGGNWLESRMCRLGGQFAGILRVEVPAERRDELLNALRSLEVDGLRAVIHGDGDAVKISHGESGQPTSRGALATIELVGSDRPGILRSVSSVFAAHGVNVEELASERVNAAMGGGMLFQARATVLVPAKVKLSDVRADLEKIAADLMVDLKLLPVDR